jgi:hypothetical protein
MSGPTCLRRDWSPSVREAGNVPDNFSFNDALSPAPFQGVLARPLGSGGNRNPQKRSGAGGLLSGNGTGNRRIEGAAGAFAIDGIALQGGDSLLDEEAQSMLTNSKKAIAERYANANCLLGKLRFGNFCCSPHRRIKKAGRCTPDVSLDDVEGTRHGLSSSSALGYGQAGSSSLAMPAFPFAGTSAASRFNVGSLGRSSTTASAMSGGTSALLDSDAGIESVDTMMDESSNSNAVLFGSQQSGACEFLQCVPPLLISPVVPTMQMGHCCMRSRRLPSRSSPRPATSRSLAAAGAASARARVPGSAPTTARH